MAPKNKDKTSVLFHPKKKPANLPRPPPPPAPANGQAPSTPVPAPPSQPNGTPNGPAGSQPSPATPAATPGSPAPARPGSPSKRPARPPRPRPAADEEERAPAPEGPFQEFRLMSSALNGWKYDVMKFDSRRAVDVARWAPPIKLNRKELRRDDGGEGAPPKPVKPMLGPDGKPVIGVDGRMVMVDAEDRPIRPGEARGALGKKRFQKKTKQVFLVPDAVRQLRKEERYPWVLEDAQGQETWVGKMEEVAKSETHGMLMPAADNVFKFVPVHRWYKFQKKPHYHVLSLEEAETIMTRQAKKRDPERWLLRNRAGEGSSGGTSTPSLVYSAGQSYGPGGRRLRTVDQGSAADLFGDDDDDEEGGGKRRVKRELGAEGDLDELDFEDDFADDEEKMEPDDREDEEAKELEERLKREYRQANKTREGYVDESEEELEEVKLTGAGKNLQKTLKKHEKDGGYDESDDEEKNPYASSAEEEEEEEPPQAPTGPAIIAPEPKVRAPSQPAAPSAPQTNGASKPLAATQSLPLIKTEPSALALPSTSQPTSPVQGHGGHSVLAKRATSPKAPKPLSPAPSRPTSPVLGPISPAPRAASPPSQGQKAAKRKATEEPTSPTLGAAGKPKKRKAAGPAPEGALEDGMVIEWLRATPGATTRDCIHHFTPWLTDEGKKTRFTALVKEVATLSKGVLVLRPTFRGAGSPAAS